MVRRSLLSDAAVVKTFDALAGETLQAFWLSLPAATATNTPAFARFVVAALSVDENPPPSDMFATAGLTWFVRSQLSALMMPEVEPLPEQLSTRRPRSRTAFATP